MDIANFTERKWVSGGSITDSDGFFVYLAIGPEPKQIYCGMTEDFQRRKTEHIARKSHGVRPFGHAIQSGDHTKWSWMVTRVSTLNEARQLEKQIIRELNLMEEGLNGTPGGDYTSTNKADMTKFGRMGIKVLQEKIAAMTPEERKDYYQRIGRKSGETLKKRWANLSEEEKRAHRAKAIQSAFLNEKRFISRGEILATMTETEQKEWLNTLKKGGSKGGKISQAKHGCNLSMADRQRGFATQRWNRIENNFSSYALAKWKAGR